MVLGEAVEAVQVAGIGMEGKTSHMDLQAEDIRILGDALMDEGRNDPCVVVVDAVEEVGLVHMVVDTLDFAVTAEHYDYPEEVTVDVHNYNLAADNHLMEAQDLLVAQG